MTGTIALVAAILLSGTTLYRLVPGAPAGLRYVMLALALVAGVFGAARWHLTSDTRWLAAGILLVGAGFCGWAAGGRRMLASMALVLALLGTALCAIATISPGVHAGRAPEH